MFKGKMRTCGNNFVRKFTPQEAYLYKILNIISQRIELLKKKTFLRQAIKFQRNTRQIVERTLLHMVN